MPLRGYIDGIADGRIHGWAQDSDDPETRPVVHGSIDGQDLGSASADEPRDDLVRVGIGDGSFGFRLPLPEDFQPTARHVVTVVVARRTILPVRSPVFIRDRHGRDVPGVELVAGEHVPEALRSPAVSAPSFRVLGDGGMLFEAPSQDLFAAQLGAQPLTSQELARAVQRVHEEQRALHVAGVRTVVATVPSKARVYPERLPAGVGFDPVGAPSARLVRMLAELGTVEAVDLADALRIGRRNGKTFLRTRTELTWQGAAVAAHAIAERVAGPIAWAAPASGQPVTLEPAYGVAAVWLGGRYVPVRLQGGLVCVPESEVRFDESTLRAHAVSDDRFECDTGAPLEVQVTGTPTVSAGRLQRMLAEHFRTTTVVAAPARSGDFVVRLLDDEAIVALAAP